MEKKLGHAHADGYDRRACDGCDSGDITLCNHDRGGLWNNSNDSNIWDCIFTQSVVGHYLYWHKNSVIPSIICPENSVKYPA